MVNLSKQEITVLDDNSRATVADLRPVSQAPLSIGIVLLASDTNFGQEQAAATELVRKLIRTNNDHAFVITAGGKKAWNESHLDWQADQETLIKDVKALDKQTGLPDAFNYTLTVYSGSSADHSAWWGDQGYQTNDKPTVFDALWGMMMTDRRPARRVLVLFRNPWAHSAGIGRRSNDYADQMHAHIVSMAQKLHVSLFTIGVEESSPASSGTVDDIKSNYGMNGIGEISRENDRQIRLEKDRLYASGRANVERIAEQSGGRAWWSTKKNYSDAVAGIVNELGGQYLLSFIPAVGTAGTHSLSVHGAQGAHVDAPNAFEVADTATTNGK
jgi:VWFA-related protein